tara:strand:+ start:1657 stop:2652 length:996 start_codon:yes stop_codon:yes gene_type:complete
MTSEINELLKQAEEVYKENFPAETWFERCIFVSWYCSLGNCTFCYRSTQKDKIVDPKMAKRTMPSIVAEAVLCKGLGWKLDFITGGFGVYSTEEMVEIAKNVSAAMGKKIWFNYGVFGESALEKFKPYVEGLCSSIETVNPKVQKEVVPGKNIDAYIEMLKKAKDFKKSLAIVIGIGETREDIKLLHDLIEETNLDRLTIFALHPINGTPFTKGPDPDYYAEWIARTRIKFPKLEIIAGVPSNLLDKAGLALRAGANAITKFPAIKLFGTEKAYSVEQQAAQTGRKFKGTLTKLPNIDWEQEVEKLDVPQQLKKEIYLKLKQYLKRMNDQS